MPQYLDLVRSKIEQFGWAIQGIGGDPREVPFHYTVGLWPHVGFELLLVGVDNEQATRFLNVMASRVMEGLRFTNGGLLDDVFDNYYCMTVFAPETGGRLNVINALYQLERQAPVPAWQMVYPDSQSRWPWDEGSKVAGATVLGEVPDEG